MDRKPFTIDSIRDACEIRTMLAYPYGTRTWLVNRYVLEDISEAYPAVWKSWRELQSSRFSQSRGFLNRIFRWRSKNVSLKAFNVFLQLGRREIEDHEAIKRLKNIG